MIPRYRSVRRPARAAGVAALAALLVFSGSAVPMPFLRGWPPPAVVLASVTSGYVSDGRAPVAPGVQHDWGTFETDRSGHQAVQLVEVDLATPGISVEAALAGDRITALERTTSLALRTSGEGHRAVAAINGDVWDGYGSPTRYAPNGIDIHAGELVTAARAARPTFGIDASGRPMIGNVLVTASVTWPDGTTNTIDHINQGRTNQQIALYTPRFGPATPDDMGGTDVVLTGVALPLAPTGVHPAVVQAIRPATGGIPIAPDTVVLNGPAGSLLDFLEPGQTLTLTLSITPGWENVREAIGGREFIVQDGAESISPHPSIADQLHPRTALGITATGGVVMATVDGRQPGYSGGVDLDELAQLMLSRGVVQALNMDGGGSTTMAVRLPGDPDVSLANRPSGGHEIATANSLVVYSATPTGPLSVLDMTPMTASLWQGESANFSVKGQDAALNGVVLADGEVKWTVDGPGTISPAGLYSATAPGTAKVIASARGIQGAATVTVRQDSFPPVARAPSSALLAARQAGAATFPVRVTWPAATDEGRGVVGYELERLRGSSWVSVPLATAMDTSAIVPLAPGQVHRFRVRATDRAGNVGAWAPAAAFRLVAVQETSAAVHRTGHWTTVSSPSFSGRAEIASQVAGASARITFTGDRVAWVSTVGPTRGQARVYVDGAYDRTVDLRAAAIVARQIVYVRSWTTPGKHTLEIRVVGTSGRPRVDVDALLTTTPAK